MSKTKTRFLAFGLLAVLLSNWFAPLLEGWQVAFVIANAAVVAATWALLLMRRIPTYWLWAWLVIAAIGPVALIASLVSVEVITNVYLWGGLTVGWTAWMFLFIAALKRRLRPNW